MRSNVTVGKGAEADMVAMFDEQGRRFLASIIPSALDVEPERSMEAAAEVVDAMDIAGGGRGWL